MLCVRMVLRGGFFEPLPRFGLVFRNDIAIAESKTQLVLGFGMAVFGGFFHPPESFRGIFFAAFPIERQDTQPVLRFGVTLVCRLAIPLARGFGVFRKALSDVVFHSKAVLAAGRRFRPLFRH